MKDDGVPAETDEAVGAWELHSELTGCVQTLINIEPLVIVIEFHDQEVSSGYGIRIRFHDPCERQDRTQSELLGEGPSIAAAAGHLAGLRGERKRATLPPATQMALDTVLEELSKLDADGSEIAMMFLRDGRQPGKAVQAASMLSRLHQRNRSRSHRARGTK